LHARICTAGQPPSAGYLPELIDLVLKEKINPGKVFDLTLPLDQFAEGYRAGASSTTTTACVRLLPSLRYPCGTVQSK
jgi:threonine dehydrogenase-like Zn-dependent dehydrogenase